MDPIQEALKWLGHNRGAVLAVIGIAFIGTAHGCGIFEGKVANPLTGERHTSSEIHATVSAAVRDYDGQIASLDVRRASLLVTRNALAEAGNEAIAEADEKTEENLAFVNATMNSPAVQGLLGPIAGGLLLSTGGLFWDRTRKQRRITVLEKNVKATA